MEQRLSNWQYVHSYQGLARAEMVKHLTCPEDGAILSAILNLEAANEDDDLALWCPACEGKIVPGVDMMSQIRAVVNEHREDIIT